MKKEQVSFITSLIRLITSPIYTVIAVMLIAIFPAKKLKIRALIKPLNIRYRTNTSSSSTEIMLRTKSLLRFSSCSDAMWIDKLEYLEYVEYLDCLYRLDSALCDCHPAEYLDFYELLEDWEIDARMEPIKEKQRNRQQEIEPEIEFLSTYIPKLCYVSLEYWPYDPC